MFRLPFSVDNNEVINGKWQVQRKIGSGGQATVYKALDISNNNQVAMKINPNVNNYSPLLREKWAYEQIMARCGGEHQSFIPTLHDYENDGETEIMVIELVGPNLHSLMNRRGETFKVDALIPIFKRTLTCIENLHSTGRVHRDIKPRNICISREMNLEDIRLIDLGFCVPYMNEKTGMHNALQYRRGITGSIRYCSFNQLIGGSATRLDDLEALCYSMMWLFKGSLPWAAPNGLHNTQAEAFDRAMQYKSRPVEEICLGLPKVFEEFLLYVRSLQFNSKPNYAYLHSILDIAYLHIQFQKLSHNGEDVDKHAQK